MSGPTFMMHQHLRHFFVHAGAIVLSDPPSYLQISDATTKFISHAVLYELRDLFVYTYSGPQSSAMPTPHLSTREPTPTDHLHSPLTVTALWHPLGTVYCLFEPDSQLMAPLLSTFMNLYSKLVPARSVMAVDHCGLAEVY
jgi:hypothetical protein